MDRNRSRTLLLSTACAVGALATVVGCSAADETVSSTGTTASTSDGTASRSANGSAASGSTTPLTRLAPPGALDATAPSALPQDVPAQSPASIPETTITITDPNQPPPPVTEAPTIPATDQDPTLIDCGIIYRASGWPTTFMVSTSYFDCLGDAFESGTPARLVDRAQTDGMGGAILITTYDVLGPGQVRVTVDATAAADRPQVVTVSMCTGLEIASYQIEVRGCTDVGS
jgi:hypothetical protein